ncbi:MAG: tetratricopeptide repeat protein [Aestuariibacter sp.]|nr:tetratricopeptide repeat protein [Aestuariibacter sp.]
MTKQVPFIGREDELAQIDTLLREWNTHYVLCIHAPGGIGKTRLLQEVRQRYTDSSDKAPLYIADIIDFDDRTYHLSQNVGRKIAQMLGKKTFEPYLRGLRDYRKMEMAGISAERVTREGQAIDLTFVNCFNKVTTQQRIVLLLDTLDALEETDAWNYILGLGLQLRNVVILIAGRNARKLYKSLRPELGEIAQLINLPPLGATVSEAYLQQKQDLLHITLEPELVQKLLVLAGGRPILIDLVVEWRAREVPLDWLVEFKLDELASLSDEAMQKQQREFEYQLVQHIADTRYPIDWLTLMMSRVYPLDIEMIVELLKMSRDEAEKLFKQAQTCVFVKSLPDARISLHDEMRRMVNEHVWPDVDPDRDRRLADSRLVAEYLGSKIADWEKQISHLEKKEKIAHQESDLEAALSIFVERDALERELWVIEERRLRHILIIDIDEGVKAFVDIFDRATRNYRFSLREAPLVQLQQYADQLSYEQLYELTSRRAMYLLGNGDYLQAKKLIAEMLARKDILPDQQVDMLLQLGDTEIRLGNFGQASNLYKQAMEICQEYDFEEKLVFAEKGLGYSMRLIGDWDKARFHYREALKLALKLGMREQEGWLQNNLAFVHAAQRERDAALASSDQALKVWESIGHEQGLGAAKSGRGSILYMLGSPEEGKKYLDEAAIIFERRSDQEWLSTVYAWRGITLEVLDDLKGALEDLTKAQDIGLKRDTAMIQSRLARVYIRLDQNDEARKCADKGYKAAVEARDHLFELATLQTLAELDFMEEQFLTLDSFKKRIEHYLERQTFPHNPALGRLFCSMAGLAVKLAKTKDAVKYYKDGFERMAKLGRYGDISLSRELDNAESVLAELASSDFIRELGNALVKHWEITELEDKHSGALSVFARWAQWSEQEQETNDE